MMRKYISIFVAVVAVVFAPQRSQALDVTLTAAGTLKANVSDAAGVQTLAVTGPVDASDLWFISSSMPSLRTLNLANAEIVAYQGDPVMGVSSYDAALVPQSIFAGSKLTSVTLPAGQVVTVGVAAFCGAALERIDVPVSARLMQGAFSGCRQLVTVTFGGAAEVEPSAFVDCTSLTTVDLGSVENVGASAFTGCESLSTVAGASVKTIGDRAFAGCKALHQFAFGSALQSIGVQAFAGTGLESADMSASRQLAAIGDWAFAGCDAMTGVVLPAGDVTVGEGAFQGCTALASIGHSENHNILGADYVATGNSALDGSTLLTEVTTHIGAYAMKDLTSTSKLTLPSTLESLGDGAMEGMTSLTQIDATQLTAVPALGSDVWAGVEQSQVKLVTSPEVTEDFRSAAQWQDFAIGTSTSANDIVKDAVAPLRGRFVGDELQVSIATGVTIKSISVYDVAGVRLAYVEPDSDFVAIDTSAMSATVFIVRAVLSDDAVATLKLSRR